MSNATVPRYQHIAARVFDTPLLIAHSKLLAILNVLGPRLGFELSEPQLRMMDDDGYSKTPDPFEHMEHLQALGIALEPRSEGHFVGEGVAIIPITGTLVQRSDWMTDSSGMQSYSRIERMVDSAERDYQVKEVLYEFDTPGGEVAGAFDFADRLFDMRTHGAKPATAVVNELAASAGYLIASAVGNVVVNRTAAVGSIGVVAAHSDYSKAMEKRGVVVTFVYAGEKKIEGNPYQPLSDAAKADWQQEVDDIYSMFIESVGKFSGMSAAKVRDTRAAIFTGFKAQEAGLAKNVNTFANEFSAAMKRARNSHGRPFYSTSPSQETQMTKEQLEAQQRTEAEAKAKADAELKLKTDAEAVAKAAADTKAAQAPQDQIAAAIKADRQRISAILALDEAKGREKLAQHLANEGMSVEAAKAALTASPKASSLSNAMERIGSPGISGDEPPDGEKKPATLSAKSIYTKRHEQAEAARPR
jgi:signal peptide peptidase SppA